MSIFDEVVERRGTGSYKWDSRPELAPYWVADMDFRSPDCVLDALHQRVDHGVFGYALEPGGFREELVSYWKESHGADVSAEWIVHMGGCVPALALAVMSYCAKGDSVMTCGPVYPPIRSVHACCGADLIEVPHIIEQGRWTFDWEEMEKRVCPGTKLFLLCNPQNPLGRVFDEDEIMRVADFCDRHGLILCSDEIHCDLVLDEEYRHISCLTLPERYRDALVVLSAPSKTYNIAGIGYSMAVIPSGELRMRFEEKQHLLQPPVHCFAYASARAAYVQGEPWRLELIAYLRENRNLLYDFVRDQMPQIQMRPMQATYLAWMDCSRLEIKEPQEFFVRYAGVYLNPGGPFGDPACVRFNFGTSRAYMLEGLEKMKNALLRL